MDYLFTVIIIVFHGFLAFAIAFLSGLVYLISDTVASLLNITTPPTRQVVSFAFLAGLVSGFLWILYVISQALDFTHNHVALTNMLILVFVSPVTLFVINQVAHKKKLKSIISS